MMRYTLDSRTLPENADAQHFKLFLYWNTERQMWNRNCLAATTLIAGCWSDVALLLWKAGRDNTFLLKIIVLN